MSITIDQIINYLSTLILAGIGIWNVATIRQRNRSLNKVDDVSNLTALNQAIDLANDRALKAEKLYAAERENSERENTKHEESRSKLSDDILLLTKRLKALEVELSEAYARPYKITFDVVLGVAPEIHKAEIIHLTERRVLEVPVNVDRRMPQ